MEYLSKQSLEALSSIVTKAAEPLGLIVLRLTARGVQSRPVIEVILDGPKLVSIDDCQIVSKALSDAIDNDESLLKGNYRLDVLSPGLDEPLIHDFQFQRTIGHLIEVNYEDGDKKHDLTGVLKAISPDEITVVRRQIKRSGKKEEGEEVRIKRDKVRKVFARADFS